MANLIRVPNGVNQDNTERNYTRDYKTPAYAASLVVTPRAARTVFQPAQLTGALALAAAAPSTTTAPYIGDILSCIFLCDGTSRTITFGANLVVTAATMVLTISKKGFIEFTFDGTAWIETSRAVLL